jgi:hypothetical protein
VSVRDRIIGLLGARRSVEDQPRLQRLEQRIQHLEALVEGLQDAIYRDSMRHEQRMTELERKTEPEALAKALSDDARRRGL